MSLPPPVLWEDVSLGPPAAPGTSQSRQTLRRPRSKHSWSHAPARPFASSENEPCPAKLLLIGFGFGETESAPPGSGILWGIHSHGEPGTLNTEIIRTATRRGRTLFKKHNARVAKQCGEDLRGQGNGPHSEVACNRVS